MKVIMALNLNTDKFKLIGGDTSLDFVNTVSGRISNQSKKKRAWLPRRFSSRQIRELCGFNRVEFESQTSGCKRSEVAFAGCRKRTTGGGKSFDKGFEFARKRLSSFQISNRRLATGSGRLGKTESWVSRRPPSSKTVSRKKWFRLWMDWPQGYARLNALANFWIGGGDAHGRRLNQNSSVRRRQMQLAVFGREPQP